MNLVPLQKRLNTIDLLVCQTLYHVLHHFQLSFIGAFCTCSALYILSVIGSFHFNSYKGFSMEPWNIALLFHRSVIKMRIIRRPINSSLLHPWSFKVAKFFFSILGCVGIPVIKALNSSPLACTISELCSF